MKAQIRGDHCVICGWRIKGPKRTEPQLVIQVSLDGVSMHKMGWAVCHSPACLAAATQLALKILAPLKGDALGKPHWETPK